MSERSPRRSSSASRKTWLSSTRTRRIGSAIRGSLFGGQEERVMRLPAGLDVELELGMALADALEQAVELGRVGPGQECQHHPRLGEERIGDLLGHVDELVADRDRLTACQAEPAALAHGDS